MFGHRSTKTEIGRDNALRICSKFDFLYFLLYVFFLKQWPRRSDTLVQVSIREKNKSESSFINYRQLTNITADKDANRNGKGVLRIKFYAL